MRYTTICDDPFVQTQFRDIFWGALSSMIGVIIGPTLLETELARRTTSIFA
jgi:hypothetical protein